MQETLEESKQEVYQLTGYRGVFASQGAKKGVILYIRDGSPGGSITAVALPHSRSVLKKLTIYLSKEELPPSALHHLKNIISKDVDTLLIGDLNYCYCSEQNAISRYLERVAFIWSVPFSNFDAMCLLFPPFLNMCNV